ncbi:hypothetical protein QNN01_03820 [Bradyrhizobium diazoefficiens]|nr:hypothetical protein [Bradyrhizobium diazoefficiens]WLA66008.1 hypothetical protein QNN01_03820 [Bradyrhizobium diazoefficiens]
MADIYLGYDSLLTMCEGNPRITISLMRPLVRRYFGTSKVIPFEDQAALVEETIAKYVSLLSTIRVVEGPVRIAVDVSSMDRSLMARVLLTVLDGLNDGETMLVLYSPSAYIAPPKDLVPIRNSTAAHPAIAVQVAPPDSGRIALLGVGYEYGVSLNILEAHEPDISFIFRPNGIDERFQQAGREANFGFDFGERNYEIVDYFLNDMAGAYDDISNLIVSTKHNSTIVAVPMGPKILSATMILAGRLHQPQVSVLRYSVASAGHYKDIGAEGVVVGVAVTMIKDREITAIQNIMSRQSY